MSDELIKTLNAQLVEANARAAKANANAKKHRLAAEAAQAELGTLRAERDALATERDSFKSRLDAAPSEHQARADKAEAALRARDHRDAWKDAIGATLQDKVTIEKVWAEAGYQPGEQVPTADEIAAVVDRVKAENPVFSYFFKPADSAGGAPGGAPTRPALAAGLGASRGAPDTSAGRFEVRKSDLQDPARALDPKFKADLKRARESGTLVVVE